MLVKWIQAIVGPSVAVLPDRQLVAIGIVGVRCALALPGHDLRLVFAVFLGLVGFHLVRDAAVSP